MTLVYLSFLCGALLSVIVILSYALHHTHIKHEKLIYELTFAIKDSAHTLSRAWAASNEVRAQESMYAASRHSDLMHLAMYENNLLTAEQLQQAIPLEQKLAPQPLQTTIQSNDELLAFRKLFEEVSHGIADRFDDQERAITQLKQQLDSLLEVVDEELPSDESY